MKILTVVGARPNFMKAAPIVAAVREQNASAPEDRIEHTLVHTGQHYDESMSNQFFKDLGLPTPDFYLGVGSGSHAEQTAEVMRRFEEVLLRERPDVVVVVGDVNSTLACALVTAKIAFDTRGTRPLVAHVEAGLRSFDRAMPEEHNRVLVDHLADILFVTEESGVRNLEREGVPDERVHFVGNTMIDSLLSFDERATKSPVLEQFGLRQASKNGVSAGVFPYALLTLHRPANVDDREAFLNILEGLAELAAECPVVFPAHPRTQKRIAEFGLEKHFCSGIGDSGAENRQALLNSNGIHLTGPLGYVDFLCLMKHASLALTDSGGIQEETTCLGVPCVTLRENTERPITVEQGTNIVAGVTKERIRKAIRQHRKKPASRRAPEMWDGHAGERIVKTLVSEVAARGAGARPVSARA